MKDLVEKYIIEKGMPKGWTKSTIMKLSSKIGKKPKDEGFYESCVTEMSKHMDDKTARGLCANIKDTALGSTYWRNKPHDKALSDVKKNQNVK